MRELKRPERAEFDNSDEFLEELNHFHFGSSEEARELVEVDSEEVRHANYKTPVRRVLPNLFSPLLLSKPSVSCLFSISNRASLCIFSSISVVFLALLALLNY